jgi:hypothetical protein
VDDLIGEPLEDIYLRDYLEERNKSVRKGKFEKEVLDYWWRYPMSINRSNEYDFIEKVKPLSEKYHLTSRETDRIISGIATDMDFSEF